MTSADLRQSFLEFFRERGHSVVPSAPLMPTSPNLLFTNAGMNQFVPYFLGTSGAPYDPPRAADTQKCIRAGGKHNDLEDVGYDTYHHTFFEMLGNWSFGDYFKGEAITWAWDLLVGRWGFPPERLYATVYRPGEGDPAAFDEEADGLWRGIFEKAGLDPAVHIVDGGKADNFWMMGETGPCGPCSEIHIDLTPDGGTRGALVNAGDARCIEIWNLVFIQYNAEADGSFRPLPARHVDTGMGFERACSVVQGTDGFRDFSALPSNYDTDVFAPVFGRLAELSGKRYGRTLPSGREGLGGQEQTDVAFRVVADHLRTLSFSIADGILPGNTDRNYVLRRILRRAVRFGRTLGLGTDGTPFLSRLLPVLVEQVGDVFPELARRRDKIAQTLDAEEESFNRTLDRGIKLFDKELVSVREAGGRIFPGDAAFRLSDTYGFPLDLTQLMAAEHGMEVDLGAYDEALQRQKDQSGATGTTVRALGISTDIRTEFTGFDEDESTARLVDVVRDGGKTYLIVDRCPLYAEMGGQVGDTGTLRAGGETVAIKDVLRIADATALEVESVPEAFEGEPIEVTVSADVPRRRAIESHHTATHLLHWALHEVVGKDVAQQGSLVAPDRLRFDFNSHALTEQDLEAVEELVNERVAADDGVNWTEVPYGEVRGREDVMQFFGDKYGERVRVVQIGGAPGRLDGYSMELCGGTHVRRTSEVGLFKIKSEGAIAAGVRRVEAVCGDAAVAYLQEVTHQLKTEAEGFAAKLSDANSALAAEGAEPVAAPEGVPAGDDLGALTHYHDAVREAAAEAGKRLRKARAAAAARTAEAMLGGLLEDARVGATGLPAVVHAFEGDAQLLQEALATVKRSKFDGAAVIVVDDGERVHLGAYVAPARHGELEAGGLIRALAPIVGGKGGGNPEMARGAGADTARLDELVAEARRLLGM